MKGILKQLYSQLIYGISAHLPFVVSAFYRYLYVPRKGSLSGILSEYSRQMGRPLRFIQVGANDGISNDPVHRFIRRDRWTGILLEPQIPVFARLSRLYHTDSQLKLLNAALGETNGEAYLYRPAFSEARWATGLATFQKEVLQSAFDSGYVRQKAAKEGVVVPQNPEKQILAEPVQVISVPSLLDLYGLPDADLLVIDTEGYDYQVLRMCMSQSQLRPGMIVYEHIHLSDSDAHACRELLQREGYHLAQMGANTLGRKI